MVVELGAVAGDGLLEGLADGVEGLVGAFLEGGLEAREAEFFAGGVGGFEETVGVEGEDVAGLGGNLGDGEVNGGEDPQRHVGGIQLGDLAGSCGEVQNCGMAC